MKDTLDHNNPLGADDRIPVSCEGDAIVLCDVNDRVTYLNRKAADLFGSPDEKNAGRDLTDLLRQVPDQTRLQIAKQYLHEEGEWSGRLNLRVAGGRTVPFWSHWVLVRDGGNQPMSVLVVLRDLQAEVAARKGARNRRRLELLGLLSTGVAHHLNDMISPVLLATGQIRDSNAAQDELLATLEDRMREASDLVSQVLTFSAKEPDEFEPIRPDLVLKALEGLLRRTTPKSARIHVDSGSPLPEILTEGVQLFHILLDLCLRAHRAVDGKATLSVSGSTATIERQWSTMLGLNEPGLYVVITISTISDPAGLNVSEKTVEWEDRVPDEVRTLMFEAQSLNGILKVRRGRDSHIEFRLFFPTAERTTQEPIQFPQSEARGDGRLILVVDDEPAIRESAKRTLVAWGYRVLTAQDGAEAVSLYAQHAKDIAVVFMDIMMPYMSGDAAIRAIVQINPAARIIAASGYTTSERLERLIDLDHVIMIQKPYTAATLQTALANALHRGNGGASDQDKRSGLPVHLENRHVHKKS